MLEQQFLELRRQVIEREFSRMNDRQLEAVTTTEGPLLVLAGAGSGKTTVLVNRIANIVKERSHVRVDKIKDSRELVKKYGIEYMDVIDEAYQKLYNFQPMTEAQKRYYMKMYFPMLNFDFVTVVVNEKDEIVAVGLGMPDISEALRKCGGKLFPLGWYYLLKALKAKKMEAFDMLLIAVRPDYQDKVLNALFFQDWIPYINQYGIKRMETTNILETNTKNIANFTQFDHKVHKRHRAYIKAI